MSELELNKVIPQKSELEELLEDIVTRTSKLLSSSVGTQEFEVQTEVIWGDNAKTETTEILAISFDDFSTLSLNQ